MENPTMSEETKVTKKTTKKVGKVTKKRTPKKKVVNRPGRKPAAQAEQPAETTGSNLKLVRDQMFQFSVEDSQRIVDLYVEEGRISDEITELKVQRKEALEKRNGHSTDLDELLNQQEQAMNQAKKSNKAFAIDDDASGKIISLFKNQQKQQTIYDKITKQIGELDKRQKAIPTEIKKLAAGLDPSGTLWGQFGLSSESEVTEGAESDE